MSRWTRKDSRFGHKFIIAGIAIGEGAGSLPPSPMLRLCCLYTKFWSICTVITLYILHIRLIKMRSKKSILFHEEAKTKNKMERNGFCVNSPLVRKYFNFATKNYAIKKSSALKTINISFNWFCTALNIKRYGFSYAVVFYFLFFIFFFNLHLRGKIPQFQTERDPGCGEDLFLELTRHFIPRTPSKLWEETLFATNPIMKENYSFLISKKSNKEYCD